MDNILEDKRFAHITKDPRFRRIPKAERKVKIDKRFQSMFEDKKFAVKYTIDKRGRPTNQSSTENLKKYYELSSSAEDSEDGCDNYPQGLVESQELLLKNIKKHTVEAVHTKTAKQKKNSKKKSRKVSIPGDLLRLKPETDKELQLEDNVEYQQDSDSDAATDSKKQSDEDFQENEIQLKVDKTKESGPMTTEIKKKLRDLAVDYARGEGTLLTESSSEEENTDNEEDDDEIQHNWGELDKEAETTDEITNRLAACNMDWDRIRAVDLMVLFNSFLPNSGLIHSVTIYPSEFGAERLKEEEVRGPIELVESKSKLLGEDEDDEENEEGSKYHMEKLREYQLNRLKYYYAVIVCDSLQTANKIYTECDGIEYESTATKLDLRFIPDDMTFDQAPREVCDKVPELSKYQPRQFITTALQQVKVELTWDETNPRRQEIAQKINCGKIDDVDADDIHAYLASGSSDEADSNVGEAAVDSEEDGSVSENDEDPITMYRSLLKSIEDQEEEKKNKNVEMEITWGLGTRAKSEKLVAEKLKKDEQLTPFEQYLEKRKTKKKMKMAARKQAREANNQSEDDDSEDSIPSDIDMNDPYFAEEFKNRVKPKSSKKSSTNPKKTDVDEADQKEQNAELELLLMDKDEDDGRRHFNMKKIETDESLTKSQKKRQKKKNKFTTKEEVGDDFEVNVQDPRFAALFSSHHFNIDPADPRYRKTKGTEALIKEKLKRRTKGEQEEIPQKQAKKDQKMNAELSALVRSVKRKSQNILKKIK